MSVDIALTARRVPRPMRLSVFYDGDCPLCQREIAFYRRRSGAERIRWIDVASCDEAVLPRRHQPGNTFETFSYYHRVR